MFGVTAVMAALALVLTGGMAGVFFSFSTSVMPGLDATKPEAAIAAMQGMNAKILNPLFYLHFMGAPLFAVVTGGLLLAAGQRSAGVVFIIAAAIYVLGVWMPTFAVNVPMNDKLMAVKIPADLNQAAQIWSDFSGRWTRWNHLRSVANSASLLFIGLGLFVWAKNR